MNVRTSPHRRRRRKRVGKLTRTSFLAACESRVWGTPYDQIPSPNPGFLAPVKRSSEYPRMANLKTAHFCQPSLDRGRLQSLLRHYPALLNSGVKRSSGPETCRAFSQVRLPLAQSSCHPLHRVKWNCLPWLCLNTVHTVCFLLP